MVGFEYSFFKIGVLYLQWTKRTGKQKTPEPLSPFSFAKEYRQEVETRTRPVIDEETGEETEDEYDYYILNVTLTNEGIQAAVDALDLTVDQIKRSVKNIFYLMGEKS